MLVSEKSYRIFHEFNQAIQNDEVNIVLIIALGHLLLEARN